MPYTISHGWLYAIEIRVSRYKPDQKFEISATLFRASTDDVQPMESTAVNTYFRVTPSSMKRLRRVQDKMLKSNKPSAKDRLQASFRKSMRLSRLVAGTSEAL